VRRNGFKTARPVARLREGRTDWYRIEAKSSAKAKVYIYDEIGYVGVSAQDFVRDINEVTAEEIELHIDSPGGDVFDGVAIYNSIHDHDATVTVIVDGIAASAASFIAQAGDKIIMNRNSTMMIHDAHGLAIGNSKDMAELAGLLDKASDNIASIYAERSGLSAEHWREAMRAETWYSADEAVEARLADEVRGKTEKAPARNDFDLTVFSYAGREQAPAPVIETPEVVPVETPVAGINWQSITDALQGAFK
jgi:ATP-dependent Clp endopeptidase proteolytic subunit ClpP